MAYALGKHLLVEFYGCPENLLNDIALLEKHMVQAAREAGATVINTTFHHFSPAGVSGVVVIQESHLAIHTWPEHGFVALDLFTCGVNTDPWRACAYLKTALRATGGDAQERPRGRVDRPAPNRTPSTGTPPSRHLWFTEKSDNLAISLRHAGVVFQAQSPFQKIEILNTYGYGNMLVLDGRVTCTERDECVYHEMIAHVPALLHPDLRSALVIGGGDGGAARELCRHSAIAAITVAEIDPTVVDAARQHLPRLAAAFNDPRVTLHIADGLDFISKAPDGAYDLILIDAPGDTDPAAALSTPACYTHLRRSLKPGGLMVAQTAAPTPFDPTFSETYRRQRTVFDAVHPYFAFIPTYATGMVGFLLASGRDLHPCRDLDEARAAAFSAAHNLQYYTPDIHRASFALPPFIQTMLGDPA